MTWIIILKVLLSKSTRIYFRAWVHQQTIFTFPGIISKFLHEE